MQFPLQILTGALAAVAVTLPHALGLGLVAFSAIASQMGGSALALWSAAVPGALMALFVRGKGVVYAPSTAVALLFGGMLTLVEQSGRARGITPAQALAITGAFVALGYVLQGMVGWARLAGLSRFLPISVMRGFSAGVGLSLVVSQLKQAWGVKVVFGADHLAWHAAIGLAVAGMTLLVQRVWPRAPASMLALFGVAVPALLWVPADMVHVVTTPHSFMLVPLPDWMGAPWWHVLQQQGVQLVSLSLLLGVVNGMEVLVFHQQLEAEHGVCTDPDQVLMRESAWGVLAALSGMIPASCSTSRSRAALAHTTVPTVQAGQWHAAMLLSVALTGHLWLHWVPLAGLAGALLVAGARMVPHEMWVRPATLSQRAALWQSWLVGTIFAVSGGAMALVSGMTVSTLVLLRTSAEHAIRRMHLHGKLRSRCVRRAEVEAWLADRMSQVAVFELQGIFSFSVAALVVDRVMKHLQGHIFVILDLSRVPSWDETGLSRLKMLAHDLRDQGVGVAICGLNGGHVGVWESLRAFDDLDRALEWVENQFLSTAPTALTVSGGLEVRLGDLETELSQRARAALEHHMQTLCFPAQALIIRAGDEDRKLMFVLGGSVVLSTSETADTGLRLAVVGPGAVFGEMAFLNGIPRTAFAHAGHDGATVRVLEWGYFQEWTRDHPEDALQFMTEFARVGIRRLGATSQALRAALE